MALFCQEIYRVVSDGLSDLTQAQEAGKTPTNPLSENHFFSAWITKALKSHRFDICVVPPLSGWQRQARTQGVQAGLKQQFLAIQRTYAPILVDNNESKPIVKTQFTKLTELLTTADCQVTIELEVGKKLSLRSSGLSSLVICSKRWSVAFDDDGQLIKPISLYVRGDTQGLIDLAHSVDLLLHKKTDYKSAVKYHGQYLIHPLNNGSDLPCIISE